MFSKDRLRKIHGIPQPIDLGDPAVLARLKIHESAAKCCEKWLTLFHAFFAIFGFVVVLLPVLSKPWRSVIESVPFLSQVFHYYSTLSGWAMVNLLILVILFFIRNFLVKSIPGGQASILTYKNIIDMELYPRTKKEEFAYWSEIFFSATATTLWLFLPFGVLAYFILIGG